MYLRRSKAVPELLNVSNIDGAQIANVGSGDISSDLVLHMSKLANYALCSENAKYDGLVITHGTDTLVSYRCVFACICADVFRVDRKKLPSQWTSRSTAALQS